MQTVQPKIELSKESEGSGKGKGKVVAAMRTSVHNLSVLFIFPAHDIVRAKVKEGMNSDWG